MNRLALFLSLLFHPVLFFFLMPFFVIYRQTNDPLYALKWELFSLLYIFTGLFLFLVGRKKGYFSDFDLTKRKERNLFYVIVLILALLYLGASLFFKGIFFSLSIVTLGIVMGILVFEVVNYYVKASVHMGIVSAWVVSMGLLYGITVFLSLVWIIPSVAWSRYVLKRHTAEELMIGFLLGVLITILTFFIGVRVFTL